MGSFRVKELQKHQEEFFLIYIVILHGMRTVCKGFFDIIWLSGISLFCLVLKCLVTQYSKKEIAWMTLFTLFAGLSFLANRDWTLLLTVFSIWGAKNVNLDRIFKWCLWSGIGILIFHFSLVAVGIVDCGYSEGMPKYSAITGLWEKVNIPQLGLLHPNYAYMSVFMTVLLAVLCYGEKVRWWGYGGLTAIMYVLYKVLYCRTGWYMWIITLVMIAFYEIIKKTKVKEWYLNLLCFLPLFFGIMSVAILYMLKAGNQIAIWINNCFTGRFAIALYKCLPDLYGIIGNSPRTSNEIGYIFFPYNYGWITYVIALATYICTMWYMKKIGKDYACLVLAIVAGYFMGEAVPISAGWNVSLLLIALFLYREKDTVLE